LLAIALMTDTDNTETALQAWYGALRLHPGAKALASETERPLLPMPAADKPRASTGNPG
jgi:hypothetical protein